MPYAEGRTVHDADSHVMETPDWLIAYADPDIRARLEPLRLIGCKPGEESFIDELRLRHRDPADRAEAEAKLMIRKNWSAIGSFVRGYDGNVESARAILAWLDDRFDLDPVIKAAVQALLER